LKRMHRTILTQLNTQAMSEDSNSTSPWVPLACNSENWSNGSALTVLFALAIGCLAHPRGSLTYNKSGRIWRLSPHLGVVEALNLISKAVGALIGGIPLHIVCVTLLAVRAGNSWTSTEYESFQEEWRKEQRHEKHESSAVSGPGHDDEPIQAVGRSRTIEAEEGDAQKASPDTVFRAQLEETERYEKGFTLRAVAWIPMLLAAVKMCAVKGGWGIWGPKVCGWMFFVSWFVTELVFIYASRHQLSEDEREKAVSLSWKWRKSWFLPREKMKSINSALNFSDGPESEDLEFELGRVASTVLLGFDSWPLVAIIGSTYLGVTWKAYIWIVNLTSGGESWSTIALFAMIPLNAFTMIYGLLIFWLPGFLYISLVYCLTSGWILYGLDRGVLLLAGRWGVSENRLSRWRQAMRVEDSDALVPGYLALFQAILTILRYARVLNDYASYDCSKTTQATWYDWTL
jgi:hypothetical protein